LFALAESQNLTLSSLLLSAGAAVAGASVPDTTFVPHFMQKFAPSSSAVPQVLQ
jgi:hypothetical protein